MRRADVVALALIFAAITVWFGDVLFTGETYFIKDLFRYHYAQKQIVREAMLSGEFPYWSPYYGAGQPLAANPAYEIFYPPQWLVLLGSFRFGFTLHIVIHAYLCALGLYLLLRSLALGPVASAFGTVAFVLGGPFLSLIRILPFLFAVTWMPFIFLFARRYFLGRGRRDFLLAALFIGIQALIAEPTTMMQTWLLVAAYAAYRAYRDPKAGALGRNALATALLVACGLVVGAAQILPTFDFARDSVRSRPIPFDVVSYSSMVPTRPLELFYPSIFQSLVTNVGTPWMNSLYPNGEPFLASFYPGVAMAILFLAGLFAWRRGSGLVLAICAVSFVIAIGVNTPLLRILYDVGIFGSIRYPEKFALAALVTIVVWGSMTLQRLLDGDSDVARWAVRVALGWFALTLLLMMFSYNVRAELGFWAGTIVRGIALLAVLWTARRTPSHVWGLALVVLTLLDVHYLQRQLNPTMPARFFDEPQVASQLDKDKNAYRIFHSADWDWAYASPAAEAYFGHPVHGPWWFIRSAMMPRSTPAWGYRMALDQDYDETFLLPTADLVQSMRDVRESGRAGWEQPFMAMSNAWYASRFRPFAEEERRAGGNREQIVPIDFVPAPEKHPRYYFADRVEPIASREEFVTKLRTQNWSPRVAFVQGEAFAPATGVVRNVRETMRTVRLEAEAAGRALLVLSITPHKYWRATVDGRETPLRVANVGYQALELPAGRHVVELTYANPLVLTGAIVSLLAVLAIVAGVAISPRTTMPVEVPEPRPIAPSPAAPAVPLRKKKDRKR